MNSLSHDLLPIRTHWWAVVLLFLAGCSTALHIGKVPSALPLLRADWQLSLTQSGLILSTYALLIATGGLLIGVLVRRFGYPRFATIGVGIVGIGSLFGGFAIFGGLIPGTCFATLPRAVSVPSAAGLLIGLMMQSSGVGQLLGGVVIPVSVDYAGTWRAAGFVAMAVGVAGSLLGRLSRIEP